ncbi:MAG TPA: hypothetical protein VFD70_05720 [Anaerolineae bacterium]|nr:hypothetical protein [Anaerolineae bacterium]
MLATKPSPVHSTLALQTPPARYTLGNLARELRTLAERNPGSSVPHVFAPVSFLKLMCHGEMWTLRIFFGNAQRPLPGSVEDRHLQEKIEIICNYLAVPLGALRIWDEVPEQKCFWVDFEWREIPNGRTMEHG